MQGGIQHRKYHSRTTRCTW